MELLNKRRTTMLEIGTDFKHFMGFFQRINASFPSAVGFLG